MTRSRVLGALLGGALATVTARVARADDPLEFTWIAPEGCPSRAEVLQRVADAAPRAPGATRPRARAVVRGSDAQGWLLALSFQEPRDVEARSFEGARCETVAGAAAYTLRLLLAIGAAPPPPPAAPEPPRPRAIARVESALVLGALPSPAPMARVTLGVALTRWRVEATFGGWPDAHAAESAGEPFALRTWELGLRVCGLLGTSRWEFRPCAGIDAGFVNVDPGNAQLLAVDSPWVGANLAAHGTWWFASWGGAFAGVNLGVNAAPVTFGFREEAGASATQRALEVQGYVHGSLAAGIELRL